MTDISKVADDVLSDLVSHGKSNSVNIKQLAHTIITSIDRKNKVTTHKKTKYVRGGRGRKYCPECKCYVGVKTKICFCGHEFEFNAVENNKKKEIVQNETISDEDRRYAIAISASRGTFMFAVAGPIPVQFQSNTHDNALHVRNFCEDVVSYGLTQNKIFLPTAIKNCLRHKVENCDDFLDMIDDWYYDKVESTLRC